MKLGLLLYATMVLVLFLSNIAWGVDESIVLYLTFDEDEGGVIKDISPQNHEGIMLGGPKYVGGVLGLALEFNGSTSAVEIPHGESLTMDDAVTLEMWIKLASDGPSANNVGIEKGGWEAGEYSLYAFYTPGEGTAMQLMLLGACGDANSGTLGPNIKDDQWHHIAGVYDGDTIFLYTDGELSISADCPGSIGKNNRSVYIGARLGNDRFLKGVIDEVRIYNRALSEAEIKKDMDTLGGFSVEYQGKLAFLWGEIKRSEFLQ